MMNKVEGFDIMASGIQVVLAIRTGCTNRRILILNSN